MVDLERLDKLTKELAEEIHGNKKGYIFELLCFIFDNLKTYCVIVDNHDIVLYMNPSMKKYIETNNLKLNVGEEYYHIWNRDKPNEMAPHNIAIRTRKVIQTIFTSPRTNNTLSVTSIPLIYDGVSGTICLVIPEDEINGLRNFHAETS